MPQFEWDEHNIDHIAEHGITPEQVEQVFENGIFELSRYIRGGEQRQNYLGRTDESTVLTVVATQRGPRLRIVTAHRESRLGGLYERLKEAQDAEDIGHSELQK